MAMHGDISFVPEVLPIAPRPIAGELISSWLLRVSFANSLTLAELVQGIEARFPEVPLRGAFIDEQLSPCARSALAKFLRVTEHEIEALELRQQFPNLTDGMDPEVDRLGAGLSASICTGESDVCILSDLYPGNEPPDSDGMDSQ
jgi:hypothetical protein